MVKRNLETGNKKEAKYIVGQKRQGQEQHQNTEYSGRESQPERKKKLLEECGYDVEDRQEEDKPTILEIELAKRGISSRKFRDEYGVDPSRIREFKRNPDGTVVFLCCEETPEGSNLYYTLKTSRKTSSWKEAVKSYEEG